MSLCIIRLDNCLTKMLQSHSYLNSMVLTQEHIAEQNLERGLYICTLEFGVYIIKVTFRSVEKG